MKTVLKVTLATLMLCLMAAASLAADAPVDMHVSCDAPNPNKQSGLRRPKGDGDIWQFNIVLDGDAHFVSGPVWHYPGKGGNDPNWGLWTGGANGDSSLSWSSPGKTGRFGVTADGKISCGNGSGGGAGKDTSIDFSVGWSGKVEFNAEIKVKRKGSGDPYSSSATVAAGGKSSDEHKADVQVIATDDDGNPLSSISVDAPTIQNGDGVDAGKDASITPSSASTDSSGKAYFTFTSSDKVITLTLEEDGGKGTSSASLEQGWTKLSIDDSWEYQNTFEIDQSSSIRFKMALDSNDIIPITSHRVRFQTIEIDGYEWDSTLGIYQPTSLIGNQIVSEGYGSIVTYDTYGESPPGSYSAQQTVHSNSTFDVFGVSFVATDKSVFEQN